MNDINRNKVDTDKTESARKSLFRSPWRLSGIIISGIAGAITIWQAFPDYWLIILSCVFYISTIGYLIGLTSISKAQQKTILLILFLYMMVPTGYFMWKILVREPFKIRVEAECITLWEFPPDSIGSVDELIGKVYPQGPPRDIVTNLTPEFYADNNPVLCLAAVRFKVNTFGGEAYVSPSSLNITLRRVELLLHSFNDERTIDITEFENYINEASRTLTSSDKQVYELFTAWPIEGLLKVKNLGIFKNKIKPFLQRSVNVRLKVEYEVNHGKRKKAEEEFEKPLKFLIKP